MEKENKEFSDETVVLDLAIMPTGWDVEKWMYMMKTHGICIIDSFNKPDAHKPYMLHSRRKMKYRVVEQSEAGPEDIKKILTYQK